MNRLSFATSLTPNRMTERQLIEGCKKGDRNCEYQLFRQYGGTLLSVCRRYARNEQEAEDWLQDGFIRIFDKLDQYRFEGSFEGWMRRVVVTTALKKFQKKSFKNEIAGMEFVPDTPVEPTVFSNLGTETLMEMISKLPDGYRVVFNLFAIEGYSHREIAQELGIEDSTSRSQLTKARRLLQQQVLELNKAIRV